MRALTDWCASRRHELCSEPNCGCVCHDRPVRAASNIVFLEDADHGRDWDLPQVGELHDCLVCAYRKPWGIWAGLKNPDIFVCVDCRDKARAQS